MEETSTAEHQLMEAEKRVIEVIKEHSINPKLRPFVHHIDQLKTERPGCLQEGWVNYLVLVTAPDGSHLVAKYVPPFIRAHGESSPLAESRATIEYYCLDKFNQLSPGSTPEVMCYSEKYNTILMEYLEGYKAARQYALEGKLDVEVLVNMAAHLATIHSKTHRDHMPTEEFNKMKRLFIEHEKMIKVMVHAFTTHEYIKNPQDDLAKHLSERTLHLLDDTYLTMCAKYLNANLAIQEALIHGDSHLSDVLTNGKDAKLIDPEFARVGDCSIEIAYSLAHLLCVCLDNLASTRDESKLPRLDIRNLCCSFMNTYMDHRDWGSDSEEKKKNFMRNVAEYTGVEMMRSSLCGEQLGLTLNGLMESVTAGRRLMSSFEQVTNIDQIVDIITEVNS